MTKKSTTQLTERKEVILGFAPDISNEPLVCKLVSEYGLLFNILKAQIGPRKEGSLTLELIGASTDIEKGIAYLKDCGVKVLGLKHEVCFQEELCMHCGMCTAMCKVNALFVDPKTRLTNFVPDLCIACGLCTKVCPVNAMQRKEEQKSL